MLPSHVKELLQDVYGTRWGEAYLEWGLFDATGFHRKGFDRALTASPPDDMAVFWSAGLLKPGTGRADANVEHLKMFVIDDVGKAAKSRFNPDMLEMMMPEPTSMPESSPGNAQWQWGITDGMAEDIVTALRRSLPFQSHATAMSNLIRVPMGVSGKPGVVHTVTDLKRGPVYTCDEFVRKCGGLKVPVRSTRQVKVDLLAPSEDKLRELLAMLPNDGTSPYCDSYQRWIDFGQAIHGASGGMMRDEWIEWAHQQPQAKYDPAEKWETFNPLTLGWDALLTFARQWGSDRGALARLLFDDGFKVSDVNNGDNPIRMFTVDDFRSVVGEVDFIHVGTGAFWKAVSVDAKVPPVPVGAKEVKATAWIRRHRYVTELSWLPGRERIIADSSMGVMGLERRIMHSIFNLYRAPDVVEVGEVNADPWLDLVRRLWPDEAEEIFNWFAHRVQRPGEKCNHALVLGGAPGIGKDTVLEAVRRAVGVGNCNEIMPSDLRTNFNDFVKSVMLVINELRDDGQLSQYAFYDKSKTLIAAPPYITTINSKYLKKYVVPNVCGVVMTSNYKETGLYLPADDRRHLVCWSEAEAIQEGDKAFADLWAWLEGGGFDHVAAWLRAKDISRFDAKAPPRKTKAFQDIVDAGGSVEEKAMADKIEKIGRPGVLRIGDLKSGADEAFDDEAVRGLDAWLLDPKYRKVIAEALGRAGYRKIRNPGEKDGRWKIDGRNETVYGLKGVSDQDLRALAGKLGKASNSAGSA